MNINCELTANKSLNNFLNPQLIYIFRLAIVAFVYALLGKIGLKYMTIIGDTSISPVWLPDGFGFATLLLGGKKYWPGIFLGALATGFSMDDPISTSISIAFCDTLELLFGTWLLERCGRERFNINLIRPQDFIYLGSVAVISTFMWILVGVIVLLLTASITQQQLLNEFLHWWQGDVLGIVLITPLILVWRKFPRDWLTAERLFEAVACFSLAFIVGQIVFLEWFHDALGQHAKGFWMFAFITWSALRFGRHGALLVIAMTTIQSLLSAVLNIGYFANDLINTGLFNLWTYLFELATIGIALSLNIFALRQALIEREQYATFFNMTRDLQCFAGQDGFFKQVNPAFTAVLGYSENELLTKPIIEFIIPEDRESTKVEMANQLKGIPTSDFENRYLCKDGSIRWLSWKVFTDSPKGIFYATARDVTERKQIQLQQLLMLLEASPEAMLLINFEGNIQFANSNTSTVFGYPISELIGASVDNLVPINISANHGLLRAEYMKTPIARSMGSGKTLSAIRKDGSEFFVEIGLTPLQLDGQRVIVAAVTDISERKQAEKELQFADTIYKSIGEAIMVADADNRIIAVNPAFTRLTGYSEAEAIGQSTKLLNSGRHDQNFYKNMWIDIEKTGHWQGEIWNRRKNGQVYLEWLVISTIYDHQSNVLQRIASFSDISNQKLASQTIWQQANFDPLTKLPNRRMFHDRLDIEIKKSNRTGSSLALMFLDIDRFKSVNDTLGHGMGDILLNEVAVRLCSCVREVDTVARLGGDEFTIILSELNDNPDAIQRIAESIRQKLAESFQLGNEICHVSSSIGIAFYPKDADSIDVLLKNADQAMYISKNLGGNRYSYFFH